LWPLQCISIGFIWGTEGNCDRSLKNC
jgi:hypothetical protein